MNTHDTAAAQATRITHAIEDEIHRAGFIGYYMEPELLTIGCMTRIAKVLGIRVADLVAMADLEVASRR